MSLINHPLLCPDVQFDPKTVAVAALPAYFKYYERLSSEHSKRSCINGWLRFCNAMNVTQLKQLQAITTEQLEAMQEKLLADGTKLSTIRLTLTLAKQCWRHLERVGLVTTNPFQKMEKLRGRAGKPEWNVLMPGELEKVEKTLPMGSLDRAIFSVLGRNGWREHVLTRLKLGMLSRAEDGRTVARFLTKGDKVRVQYLDSESVKAADAWRKVVCPRGNAETFFVPSVRGGAKPPSTSAMYKTVVRVTKKVLGRKVTPHGLRATWISSMIAKHGLEAARQLADHTSIITTQRYSRWAVVDPEKGHAK